MRVSVLLAYGRARKTTLAELSLATAALVTSNAVMIGIGALIPLIRDDLGLSGPEIGIVAAAPWVASLILVRLSAGVIERRGASFGIGVSQLFCAAGVVIAAAAPNVIVLIAGAMVAGVGFGLVSPASNVLSMGVVSSRRRGLAMSIKQTGTTIGGVLAGLLLPTAAAVTSWRAALLLPAGAALAVAAWGLRQRRHGIREPLVLAGRTISLSRSRLGLYGFAMIGIQLAIFGYVTVYLVDDLGFSAQLAGVGLAVALGAGTVGRIVWGLASDRSSDRLRVLRAAAVGSAVGLLLIPLSSTLTIWPLLLILGFCSVGWNGMYQAVVAESGGAAGVGRATTLILPFTYSGTILVPPLLGLVVELSSWDWFWWVGAATAGSAAAAARMGRRPAQAFNRAL